MPRHKIAHASNAPSEWVEADRVAVEAKGQIVLHKFVTVIGQPRETVVRRLRGADVVSVEPE